MKRLFLPASAVISFIIFAGTAQAVTPVPKGSGTLPVCPRPRDFSVGKDVEAFEACVQRQEKFCERNDANPNCKKVLAPKNADRIKTGPGSDTAAACVIQKDGAYKCEQEMVRFLVPEETIQPLASPTGLPTINEDGTVSTTPLATPATGEKEKPGTSEPPPPPSLFAPPPKGFSPK